MLSLRQLPRLRDQLSRMVISRVKKQIRPIDRQQQQHRSLSTYSSKVLEQYRKYAEYSPSPVSLSHFLHFGEKEPESRSYNFLHREIPVRLANMMQEIELLPDELLRQQSCRLIQDFYMLSFGEMIEYENAPQTLDTFAQFAETLDRIRNRHSDTVEMMAEAVMSVTHQSQNGVTEIDAKTQYFLDRLYMSRISIRMLINQHLMLYGGQLPKEESDIGCISPHCNVAHIVNGAYQNASFLCDQTYMRSPEMMLDITNTCDPGIDVVEFVYVPAHLYHILFELFKNALRATIEHLGEDVDEYPPIQVLVVKSEQDISIRISDKGGGVPRQISENLFHYMYSTAPRPDMGSGGGQAPMAGLGYGLPLSRLYARYFRGDIALTSLHGVGTDVVVYLRALAEDAAEVLPVFNNFTKKSYLNSESNGSDWTDPIPGFYPRNGRH